MTPQPRPARKVQRVDRREGSGRTQEQRRTEARAALLEAAREIVARRGWVGMTLGEVGLSAGYSRGIAAHHFGTKPELLRALAQYIGQRFTSTFKPAAGRERGFHALLQFIGAYLGRGANEWINTRSLLILMAEGTTDDSELAESLSEYNHGIVDFLQRHFQEAVDLREIRNGASPRDAAFMLLGTLRGIMLQKLLKNSRMNLQQITRELITTLIHGYARKPAPWLETYLDG